MDPQHWKILFIISGCAVFSPTNNWCDSFAPCRIRRRGRFAGISAWTWAGTSSTAATAFSRPRRRSDCGSPRQRLPSGAACRQSGSTRKRRNKSSIQAQEIKLLLNFLRYYFLVNIFLGDFFSSYYIQHCFICRPSDSTVTTDAGIELVHWQSDALTIRLDHIRIRYSSYFLPYFPVFRICDIWIRILGSVPLSNRSGSGSCSFRQ
jgi:hypothetical protein